MPLTCCSVGDICLGHSICQVPTGPRGPGYSGCKFLNLSLALLEELELIEFRQITLEAAMTRTSKTPPVPLIVASETFVFRTSGTQPLKKHQTHLTPKHSKQPSPRRRLQHNHHAVELLQHHQQRRRLQQPHRGSLRCPCAQ